MKEALKHSEKAGMAQACRALECQEHRCIDDVRLSILVEL